MMKIAGFYLKQRHGVRYVVTPTDVHTMPHKHHMTPDLRLYKVVEELDANDSYAVADRYFDTLEEARAECVLLNARYLQTRMAKYVGVTEGFRNKLILFRYNLRKSRFFKWAATPQPRRKIIRHFLENVDYIAGFCNTLSDHTIPVDRIEDDTLYTVEGDKVLFEGDTLYRVQWSWPETNGVTLDPLTIQAVTVSDNRDWKDDDEGDFTLRYAVAMYSEGDGHTTSVYWKDGILRGGSQSVRYFTNREEAEAFQAAKRAELVAKISGA
jgi:hypothetical protein